MPWSIKIFNTASRRRKIRQDELEEKLRTFKPEDRQKVRAYLAVNGGDEAFIRQLLSSGNGTNS